MIDHYKLLGVDRKATKQQIKAAFRRLAKLFHPDKNPQNREEAERKFREILIAYQTLANDRTRAAYDRMLEQHELKRRSQAARRPKPPKDPIAQRCERMLFDLLNGRYEEGVVEYEKLKAELREFDLFKHLSYADARDCEFLLAEAYHVLGRYEEAAEMYERVLDHESQKPHFRRFTDEIVSRLRKIYSLLISRSAAPEAALDYTFRLLSLGGSKRQIAKAYKRLAELYLKFGQVDLARSVLDRAFKICPNLPGSKRICRKLGINLPA